MKLSELHGKGLEGGTLVEYERGYGFSREWGRATIVRVGVHADQADFFEIETDSDRAFMGLSLTYYGDIDIHEDAGIYFWASPQGWCYAVAPAGKDIPEPPGVKRMHDRAMTEGAR